MQPFARYWLSIVSICVCTSCWADRPPVDGWWHAKSEEASPIFFEERVFLTTSGKNICGVWRDYSSVPDQGAMVYLGHFYSGKGVLVKKDISGFASYPDITFSNGSLVLDQKEIVIGATKLIVRERFRRSYPIRYDSVLYDRVSLDVETIPSANLDASLCAEAMKIGQ
jgi:hypothetical protein